MKDCPKLNVPTQRIESLLEIDGDHESGEIAQFYVIHNAAYSSNCIKNVPSLYILSLIHIYSCV